MSCSGFANSLDAARVARVQPVTVVVSLPVADLDRSLRFYRDGLGIPAADVDEGGIVFELPNLSLFLIEAGEYARYVDRAGLVAPGAAAGACVLSCAIGSRAEVDETVMRAAAAGGSAPRPAAEYDGSYIGYFGDPDGHLWELVTNDHAAAAAQRAALDP